MKRLTTANMGFHLFMPLAQHSSYHSQAQSVSLVLIETACGPAELVCFDFNGA